MAFHKPEKFIKCISPPTLQRPFSKWVLHRKLTNCLQGRIKKTYSWQPKHQGIQTTSLSSIKYVLYKFLLTCYSRFTKYFWRIPYNICSPNLFVSFGTFWVKVGHLSEQQWDCEDSWNYFFFIIALKAEECRFPRDLQRLIEYLTNLD